MCQPTKYTNNNKLVGYLCYWCDVVNNGFIISHGHYNDGGVYQIGSIEYTYPIAFTNNIAITISSALDKTNFSGMAADVYHWCMTMNCYSAQTTTSCLIQKYGSRKIIVIGY